MDTWRHFTNEWSELWLDFVMKIHKKYAKENANMYSGHLSEMHIIERNKNLTMDVVEKHMDTIKWDFRYLSENPNLTFDFIKKYRRRKWNKSAVTRNGAFTIDEITQNTELHANYDNLSDNPNLTIDHVLQKPNAKWNWYALAKHPNMTIDVILNNPELPWYSPCGECQRCKDLADKQNFKPCALRGICVNQSLTIDFIRNRLIPKTTDIVFFWSQMSRCKNISIDDIVQNPDLPFRIQYNPNLSFPYDSQIVDDMQTHDYFMWQISENPCTTMEIIMNNPNEPWDFSQISKNPNLTMKMLRDHPNKKWYWRGVLKQPFDEDRNTFIEYHVKWLLLLMIYDNYCVMDWNKKGMRIGVVEMVLANDYLVKHIINY